MIFIAKNEEGIPSWKLVLNGMKTVTRRLKPMDVDKVFAVQPGRGKFAVCKAKVISCIACDDWYSQEIAEKGNEHLLDEEAHKEGFGSWDGLLDWLIKKYGEDLPTFYRIEFEKLC